MKYLRLKEEDVLDADNAQLLPAIGAALADSSTKKTFTLSSLIEQLHTEQIHATANQNRLPALFKDDADYQQWELF